MRTYEVFLKRPGKDPFVHAGSLDAPDDELARVLARETYLRRAEGEEAWLVARDDLVVLDRGFIAPNADKPHRHDDGAELAARRRERRSAANPTTRAAGPCTDTVEGATR
ncbi:MAG: 1,2-phenylacetyl-CoA epoxidase subunit B [Actinomycetota bacterium]|nr:1,2-phenylacetyl-CoA epoxidase subunit B [Actinomycetota bacterium]